MPKEWNVCLVMSALHGLRMHDVFFRVRDNTPELDGNLKYLLETAGCKGQLYFFPEQNQHGMPLALLDDPLKPKFWWTFGDVGRLQTGMMRPMNWGNRQAYSVRVSMADFIASTLTRALIKRVKEKPDLEDLHLDGWLAELMVMFSEWKPAAAEMVSAVPGYGADVDHTGKILGKQLDDYMVFFGDGSRMRVDTHGYAAVDDMTYLVPDTSKPVMLQGSRVVGQPLREVTVQPYEKVGAVH